MTTRIAALAACAWLAACDAPYGTCRPGDRRDPGPGCTAPELATTTDGDPTEWAAAGLVEIAACDPVLACDTSTCSDADVALRGCCPGDITSLQFALDGASLVLHAEIGGPPADRYVAFVQALYPVAAPATIDTYSVFVQATGVSLQLDQIDLAGYPLEGVLGAHAFEVRVPFDVMPFRTSAIDAIGPGQCNPPADERAYACWDPAAPEACGTY